MQFAESLSDRQPADAVRSRIDWKYALSFELTNPGFDHTVLGEFRTQPVAGQAELLRLNTFLAWVGYKVHLTETCEDGQPHLITGVMTTPATTPNCVMGPLVQDNVGAWLEDTPRATTRRSAFAILAAQALTEALPRFRHQYLC